MSPEVVQKFWELWFKRSFLYEEWRKTHRDESSHSIQEIEDIYDTPLGVISLSAGEVVELCDRVPVEKWERFPGDRRSWRHECGRIFVRVQGKYYGQPPEGAKHYGVSVCSFPIDLVEKVAAFGCLPPFPEKPGPDGL